MICAGVPSVLGLGGWRYIFQGLPVLGPLDDGRQNFLNGSGRPAPIAEDHPFRGTSAEGASAGLPRLLVLAGLPLTPMGCE